MTRDAGPARKTPRPRRCWKCHYDLTGLAEDADCPECGANQPADEVFENDPDRTDTVFQRVDTPPMWAAGSVAHVGKSTRPSADDDPDAPDPHLSPAEIERNKAITSLAARWVLRLALVGLGSGFAALAIRQREYDHLIMWSSGFVALLAGILLIATFVVPRDRTSRD